MKKYILSFFFTLASFCSFGQIVISQVYEGLDNNKWIEITNVGVNAIDLSYPIQFKVGIWQSAGTTGNGVISGNPTSFILLSGTLLHGQKYLIRNSNAATNVPHATMPTANNSNSTVAAFDGNDALAIFSGTNKLFDIFGVGFNYNDSSYIRNSGALMGSLVYNINLYTAKTLSEIATATINNSEYLGTYTFFGIVDSISGDLSSLNTTYGSASAVATFTISRGISSYSSLRIPPPMGLCGDLILKPPVGFEISETATFTIIGTNTSPINIGNSCTVPTKTIYTRLSANNPVGNYNGDFVFVTNLTTGIETSTYLFLPTASTNMVSPIQLNISGVTANDKLYDGTTLTTLNGTPTLNGVLPGQVANVTIGGSPVANFNDELPGNNKPVTVTGYTISGSAASNYVVAQPSGLTASIFPNTTVVNLKLFIEGYYSGGNTMTIANANRGVTSILNSVDDIEVELRNTTTFLPIATTSAMLNVDGTAICTFNSIINGLYYIVVKGSNIIQTWSANPVIITSNPITYDYTTSMSKAYGNNMIELEPGVFGIYSGDINQDGTIDGSDVVDLYNDIESSAFGDLITDLNGDGVVDNSDLPIFENNLSRSIFSDHP